MCQVTASGDGVNLLASVPLLICWNMETGTQRRLLVNGLGDVYMENGRGGAVQIGSSSKYTAAVGAVLRARAN